MCVLCVCVCVCVCVRAYVCVSFYVCFVCVYVCVRVGLHVRECEWVQAYVHLSVLCGLLMACDCWLSKFISRQLKLRLSKIEAMSQHQHPEGV